MVEKRWRLPVLEEDRRTEISERLGCSPLLALLLHRRGILTAGGAEQFLHPKLTDLHDPFELPDMEKAVHRIERALSEREPIAIFGDYDVDGISATCLLRDFFKLLGVPVQYRLPHRLLDGYGLRCEAVRELARDGVKLIVTVDNGSSSIDEVDLAAQLGVDVVITDHHQAPSVLPRAVAVVNPFVEGSTYPFRHLAGVGVAFKLAWALAQRLSRQKKLSTEFRNFLLESLALVALGTISDVVPLLGENRVLAKYGLLALREAKRAGLRLLVQSAMRDKEAASLEATDVAFRLGPRINAVGRLGRAEAAIRLLLSESEEEARLCVENLEAENRRRQKIEGEIFDAARSLVLSGPDPSEARAIVLAGEGWHPGVIGIVAARIAQEFYRPTLLISVDGVRARGSARSIPGVNICEALAACRRFLIGFGGHEMAAGVEIEPGRVDELREALNAAIPLPSSQMVPFIDIDAEVSLADLSLKTLGELSLLAPHGTGNPQPVLSATQLDVVGGPRTVGDGGRHLAFHVRQGSAVFRAIAFGKGKLLPQVSARGTKVSLLMEPRISRWQGRKGVELNVIEMQIS